MEEALDSILTRIYDLSLIETKVQNFANKNQGSAPSTDTQTRRPDSALVREAAQGRQPLSALSSDCD